MKLPLFYLLLVLAALVGACHGQQEVKKNTTTEKAPTLGTPLSELNKTIWFIYQDKTSRYWFASKEHGLFSYDGKGLTQFTSNDGLPSNQIRAIQEDAKGNLFFETTNGISKFDGETFTTLTIKKDAAPNDWQLNPNDLWFRVGFDQKGLYRYDGEYLYYLEFPKAPQEDAFYQKGLVSYSPYGIYSIYKDRQGVMWFGTASLGVCRFDGQSFSWHYEEQLQTTPGGGDFGSRAIFEDKDGFFWLNNTRFRYELLAQNGPTIAFKKSDGISYVDANHEVIFPFFLSIVQSDEGDLWMATYDEGVWRNNGQALLHYPIKDGDTDVLLLSIYKDRQGTLWLGTFNAGVYRFNGTSFEKFQL